MSPNKLEWPEFLAFTIVIGIYAAPIVLIGCIIGELLYRFYIVPKSLPFKLALVIYALLGSIIMLLIMIFLGGIPQNITDLFVLFLIGLSTICSIVFFIKRNTYK